MNSALPTPHSSPSVPPFVSSSHMMISCISMLASGHTSIVSPSFASYTFSIAALADRIACFERPAARSMSSVMCSFSIGSPFTSTKLLTGFPLSSTRLLVTGFPLASTNLLTTGFPFPSTSLLATTGFPLPSTSPAELFAASSSSCLRRLTCSRKADLKSAPQPYRSPPRSTPAPPSRPRRGRPASPSPPGCCADTESP